MKAFAKVLVPVAIAFGAIGAANAQAINYETDYPPQVMIAKSSDARPASVNAEPLLIQSNQGAVEVNPAYVEANKRTREEVRREAGIAQPIGPAFNA